MRWQPQSGWACLSIRMVRRVSSGRRLPGGVPLGLSIRPAGPSASKRRFHSYSVYLDRPTRAAKSAAGRPLRCQVSNSSRRCSGDSASAFWSAFLTSRRPRRGLSRRGRSRAAPAAPASAAARSSAPRRRSSRSSAARGGSPGAAAVGGGDGSWAGDGSSGCGDGKCSDIGPPVVGVAHRLGGGNSFTPLNLHCDSHFGKWHSYETACLSPSDVHEHLPTLHELAKDCGHITELGTRSGVSTLALLRAQPKKLVCYDLVRLPEVDQLARSEEHTSELQSLRHLVCR